MTSANDITQILSRYNSTLRDNDAIRKSLDFGKPSRERIKFSRARSNLALTFRGEGEREARSISATTARIDVATERSRSDSKTSKIIALFPDRAVR